jgi:hypothetical protein
MKPESTTMNSHWIEYVSEECVTEVNGTGEGTGPPPEAASTDDAQRHTDTTSA